MILDISKDKVDEKDVDKNSQCDLKKKFVAKLVPDLVKEGQKGEEKSPKQHPKFPNFSDAISVQYDPNGVRGRYCVASRDIEPGELVAVETPFVWMLDKDSTKGVIFRDQEIRKLCVSANFDKITTLLSTN